MHEIRANPRRRVTILTAALAVTIALGGDAGAASFTGLGHLGQSPSGAPLSSAAHAVSGDGSTIVGRSTSGGGNNEAFRWTVEDGLVGLGGLPNANLSSQAHGVSYDGSVIVGQANSSSGFQAFRWTSGGMVGLGQLPGGSFSSIARGISWDGSLIVGSDASTLSDAGEQEAFIKHPSQAMTPLGDLPGGGFSSKAYAASSDGSTVVGVGAGASGGEAFRWTLGEGLVPLGDLDGGTFRSDAYAVSADGSVIVGVGTSGSGLEAFRWTQADGMVGLGDLAGGSFGSAGLGVSADGGVVVGRSLVTGGGFNAFIWDAQGDMRRLETVLTDLGLGASLAGWTLTEATGISADGRVVVGVGINSSGLTEAWRAELFAPAVPEPGTLALAALGLAACGARRAMRSK